VAMRRIPPYTRISDDLRLTANHLPKGHQSHAKRRPFGRQKTAFCNVLDYQRVTGQPRNVLKNAMQRFAMSDFFAIFVSRRQDAVRQCHVKKLRLFLAIALTFRYLCFHNINTNSIMEEDNKQDKNQQAAGSYLAIGICFGVAFGIIFDNLAVWMCLGVGIGLLAPSFLKNRNNDGDKA
jgi:hypothetical protein